MTVVYLDRVVLLNLAVDYLLLLATARLAGLPLRRRRLGLCAALGAAYAAAVFLPGCRELAHPLCRLAAGTAMCRLAWRRERRPWRLTALFFLLSGALAGLLLAMGSAIGFGLLLHLVFRQGARHEGGELMDVTVSLQGRRQRLRALHDTGNTLRDPVSGQPVLVLEQDALRELWPPEAARIVEMRLPPEEKMARLHRLDGTCRWSLLPFCAVGTEAGLLLAVRSDYVKVGSITYPRILLALTPGAVSDGGGYQALWGGRKERRHGESAAAASAVAQRPAG